MSGSNARVAATIKSYLQVRPVRSPVTPSVGHFVDVNKMVDLGSGSQRELDDRMLTRYAFYLVARNGDPIKDNSADCVRSRVSPTPSLAPCGVN